MGKGIIGSIIASVAGSIISSALAPSPPSPPRPAPPPPPPAPAPVPVAPAAAPEIQGATPSDSVSAQVAKSNARRRAASSAQSISLFNDGSSAAPKTLLGD